MKNTLFIFTAILALIGCSVDKFVGSGETVSEFRNVAPFNKVASEGTFNVTITKGTEQSVEIIADDNIMQRVRTEVVNGKLKLYLTEGRYTNVHLQAYIEVVDLVAIENSGSGDMNINNNLDVETFKAFNSGSGNIHLEGNCSNLDIHNEGSGSVLAFNMPAENCDITIEGSGDVEVTCASSLNVKIEGSGNVYYKGTPAIFTDISGSGKVKNSN